METTTIQSIRESVAHLFEGCKFKGLQTVHFFHHGCIEIGVIQEVKKHSGSSQPSYIVTFLAEDFNDDDFKLANVEVDEEDIFRSCQEICDFAKDVLSSEDRHGTLKHFQKTQFLKEEFQEGVPLDEFIYQSKK